MNKFFHKIKIAIHPKRPQKMSYILNKKGSLALMLYLLFNTYYFVTFINSYDVSGMTNGKTDWKVLIIILTNLFLSLLVFLTASKIKYYDFKSLFVVAGLVVFQAARYGSYFFFFDKVRVDLFVANSIGLIFLILALLISYRNISIRKKVMREENL